MKQSFSSRSFVTTCFALLGLALFGLNAVAHAEMIGPGALAGGSPDTSSDGNTDQSRINVLETFTQTPAAGTYEGTTWEYNAGQTGSVTPFIAKLTGNNIYEILAVGDQVDVTSTGIVTGVAFGGSPFTLDGSTVIFAGITNPTVPGSQNPINQSSFGGNTTDHSNNKNGQIDDPVIVGGTVDGFSHANLGRTYHFSINVEPAVPEPTTFVLALLGLLGVMGCALRRRRAR